MRNGTSESVAQTIAECHRQAGPRFMVGAGCEIPRDTPAQNLRALADYAHQHNP
jgi:uroporphyrinogen-III decarboxylase